MWEFTNTQPLRYIKTYFILPYPKPIVGTNLSLSKFQTIWICIKIFVFGDNIKDTKSSVPLYRINFLRMNSLC